MISDDNEIVFPRPVDGSELGALMHYFHQRPANLLLARATVESCLETKELSGPGIVENIAKKIHGQIHVQFPEGCTYNFRFLSAIQNPHLVDRVAFPCRPEDDLGKLVLGEVRNLIGDYFVHELGATTLAGTT